MKKLSNYINEKLDINNVNLRRIDFPLDKSVEEVANFLIINGFQEIEHSVLSGGLEKKFNNANGKAFIRQEETTGRPWIRFADTSNEKISTKNPMFFYSPRGKEYGKDYPMSYTQITNKEFLNEITKKFDF